MPHTIGPWAYDPETCAIVAPAAPPADPEFPAPPSVCSVMSALGGEDTNADLALMVAAPVMLGALYNARDRLAEIVAINGGEGNLEALDEVRRAITEAETVRNIRSDDQAEGEPQVPTPGERFDEFEDHPIGETDKTQAAPMRCCPQCGDAFHLYAPGDFRYDPVSGLWKVDEIEDSEVECTNCDWRGEVDDLVEGGDDAAAG